MDPQIGYSLDCLATMGYITADVHKYFYSYCEFDVVKWYDKMFTGKLQDTGTPNDFDKFCVYSAKHMKLEYNKWYQNAKPESQASCLAQGIKCFPDLYRNLKKHIVGVGLGVVIQADKTDQEIIDLFTLDVVREVIQNEVIQNADSFQRFNNNWSEVWSKCSRLTLEQLINAERVDNNIEEDLLQLRQNIRHMTIAIYYDAELKKIERAKRKTLKRSLNVLTSFTSPITTKMFISGESILVEGEKFNFLVQKSYIKATGSGALKLVVTDKLGEKLVNLCWYVENTPSAEQLLALMLDVKHGREEEIIRVGNIMSRYNTSNDSYKEIIKIQKTKPSPKRIRLNDADEWEEEEFEPREGYIVGGGSTFEADVRERIFTTVYDIIDPILLNQIRSPELRLILSEPLNNPVQALAARFIPGKLISEQQKLIAA